MRRTTPWTPPDAPTTSRPRSGRPASRRRRRRHARRRAHPQPGRDRQPARLRPGRRRRRRAHRHPGDHQLRARLLRAPADAGDRVRPPGAVDDHQPAQLHLRQRRGQPRQHLLDPLRRLPELDPAAGDAGGVPRRGARQLRPAHGRLQPDLLDRRRAAGRAPRHRGHAHRGPALHHHRARAGAADGRGHPGRRHAPPSSR